MSGLNQVSTVPHYRSTGSLSVGSRLSAAWHRLPGRLLTLGQARWPWVSPVEFPGQRCVGIRRGVLAPVGAGA
ncbi:uncharacterized protein METZ01_LOCUS101862 [marine metagenome]|uniref:Uncharacterized protein n=1 Tax=marine metagenome TaxID=408172 RepID=A0A381WAG8_9ZZZZ